MTLSTSPENLALWDIRETLRAVANEATELRGLLAYFDTEQNGPWQLDLGLLERRCRHVQSIASTLLVDYYKLAEARKEATP